MRNFFTRLKIFKKAQPGLVLTLMLLFTVSITNAQDYQLVVTEPANIAGEYDMLISAFGPSTFCDLENVNGETSIAIDGAGIAESCDTVTNDMTGKITIVDRGSCSFVNKVLNAQSKGAIAVIICNNVSDPIINPGGTSDEVTIPSFMLSLADCNAIRMNLEGTTVNINRYADDSGEVVLWESQFDGGLGDWTSNSISCGGAPADTFQLWRWDPDGAAAGGSCGSGLIISVSRCNGAASFASDAYDNLPDATCGTGGGPCPAPQIGELISPSIDLSDIDAAGVSLRFHQTIRRFTNSNSFVGWSIDGGTTWDSVLINEEFPINDPFPPSLSIVKVPLVGAAGQSDVRFKIRYEATYYYWVIDDVQLVAQEANNLRVNANFFATPPNAMTPLSQVEAIPFLADIENVGAVDQTNVILNMEITDQTSAVVGDFDNEYGTVAANTIVENQPFTDVFLPSAQGDFHGTYHISSDSLDADTTNTFQEFDFMVTDTVFAKEFGTTNAIEQPAGNWDATAPWSYAYGNHFYIPNGVDSEGSPYVVRSISFALRGTPETTGLSIPFVLYKWNDQDPESNPVVAEAQEREFVAFAFYTIQGTESENDIITIPFPEPNDYAVLEAETHYLLMMEYQAEEQINLIMGAGNTIDYAASRFTSNLLGAPRFADFLAVPDDGNLEEQPYSTVTFTGNAVPVLRMNVVPESLISTSAKNVQAHANEFQLFPNPVSDQISLQLDLEEVAENATVRILDIQGRQVMQQTYKNLKSERFNYDLSKFASGAYMLQLVTDKGSGTKRFLVK